MLFLGLSLMDRNMRLLQRLARAAEDSGVESSSVVVMKVPEDEQERLRFATRVPDLAKSGITGLQVDTHSDSLSIVKFLIDMLRPARQTPLPPNSVR